MVKQARERMEMVHGQHWRYRRRLGGVIIKKKAALLSCMETFNPTAIAEV